MHNEKLSAKEYLEVGNALFLLLDKRYFKVEGKERLHIAKVIDEKILPAIEERLRNTHHSYQARVYSLYIEFYKISCRALLRNFAFYVESFKRKKVFALIDEAFRSVFHYASEFVFDDDLELFRLSCSAGMGKSYVSNLVVAMLFGNNPNLHVLRITYSDDLVKITTNQTEEIIMSEAFSDIFPRYKGIEGEKRFKKKDQYSFVLVDCEDASAFHAVTREGQATGKRADYVIIDDLLKGETESNNVSLHKQLVNRYDSDWTSRADGDKLKIFLIGTMWANTDLLNVVYERALEFEDIVPCIRFPYTEISADRKHVFIGIPALDKNDKSTCPKKFSTAFLLRKRAIMDEYLWSAMYQQKPIAPSGLEFAYDNLQVYEKKIDTKGSNKFKYLRKASLDPARKGKNYVSMPIFYEKNDLHYVVDWLFQRKDMQELYIPICSKIIDHRVQVLVLENNTDTSLKVVLEEILHARGYFDCEIIEIYSTQNKEAKIRDNRSTVINNIVFPAKGLFAKKSDVAIAIEELTNYSFDYPNKSDDAIDSVVLYAMQFITTRSQFASIRAFQDRKRM